MRLKVLTANIAFALPSMNRLLTNVRGHLAVHRRQMVSLFIRPSTYDGKPTKPNRRRVKYLRRRTDLTSTLSLIEKENPDIVALNEVLVQFHGEELQWSLSLLGYRSFAWGMSGHHPDATISTFIASKMEAEPVSPISHALRGPGSGGGAVALRLKDHAITAVAVHLPLPWKLPKVYAERLKEIIEFIRREQSLGRKIIALGDWNAPSSYIHTIDRWPELRLVNADHDIPTCPTFFKKLKPLDHIFVPPHWKAGGTHALAFGSDHLALSTVLETE